MRVSGEMIVIW